MAEVTSCRDRRGDGSSNRATKEAFARRAWPPLRHPRILVRPTQSGLARVPTYAETVRPSISLGRVAGIKVGVNASVFLIVVILVSGLATGQLPAAFPDRSIPAYVIAAIIAAVLFLASLLAHELAHSLVARRNGVEVESIVLWLLGGVAQLRGEARTPGADFRIAIVGPLTSLGLAIGFGLAAGGLAFLGATGLPFGVLAYLAATNAMLAVFNLIPAAPLDGGRVLRAALWRWRGDRQAAAVNAARAGTVLGLVFIALGVLQVVTGYRLSGVWLALIGWFVVSAATAEKQQAKRDSQVADATVRDGTAPSAVDLTSLSPDPGRRPPIC
jgi:Zn-dependent protease